MLPNQVLNAIPRQKVKCVTTGVIGSVIRVGMDEKFVAVMRKNPIGAGEFFEEWLIKDCEPVPEKPRPLRVGDKVKVTNTSVFSTIKQVRIAENGWTEQYLVDQFWQDKGHIRHATPQELKDYFLND